MKRNYEEMRREIVSVFKEEIEKCRNYTWYETGRAMVYFIIDKEVNEKEFNELSVGRYYTICECAESMYYEAELIDPQCYISSDSNSLYNEETTVRYKKVIGNTLYAIIELSVGPEYDRYEELSTEEMECIGLETSLVYALIKIKCVN